MLGHAVESASGLLRDERRDPGRAESALTATHSGAQPPFHAVDRTGAERAVDRVADLPLGHGLAAADDVAVAVATAGAVTAMPIVAPRDATAMTV